MVDGADPLAAAPFEEITKHFKMTLTEMAQTWFDRNTFADVKDLEKKVLTDFSHMAKPTLNGFHNGISYTFAQTLIILMNFLTNLKI